MPEPRAVTRAGLWVTLLVLILTSGAACRPAMPARAPSPSRPPLTSGAGAIGGHAGESSLRPYAQIITSSARTRDGLFKTHLVGTKLYFEIPAKELNRDMLLVGQVARTRLRDEYLLPFSRVLRWERRGNQVLLRNVSYEVAADSSRRR
ncbi:MAG: DUF5118 domain-containing protein [Gemmatimonadaceae bacterium]